MLQITPHHRFFLGVEPLDFRKGIDAIAGYCKNKLQTYPMSGAWFIFINRKKTAVKLLVYDGQGFWLCMKRFSQVRLALWPKNLMPTQSISAQHLQILLYQGDPMRVDLPPDWKRI